MHEIKSSAPAHPGTPLLPSAGAASRRHTPQRFAALASCALACASLAACGGSSSAGSPDRTVASGSSSPPAASTPTTQGPPTSTASPSAPTGSAGAAARPSSPARPNPSTRTPRTLSPAARTAAQARLRVAFTKFTGCMRAQGVNVPEPGTKPKPRAPIDTKTPQFKAALAKCRGVLTAALKSATKR
jgi:hypothetical protein